MSELEKKLLRIASGEARGPGSAMTRAGLRALSFLYLGGIEGYLALYKLGVLKTTHLPCKVISVGNLTLGGTGKTTTVRTLVRKLNADGYRVVILSYGYRGDHDDQSRIVSDGKQILMDPSEAGDEPVMLAKDLPGTPVIMGPHRIESGRLAIEKFHPDVILLDDGFQYWRLAKDLEIVLLDATLPFGYGAVLPRGLLREPVHHLKRAGAVVITHADRISTEDLQKLCDTVQRIVPGIPLACCRHAATKLRNILDNQSVPLESLKGLSVFALSSLGNPGVLENTLQRLGSNVVGSRQYRDHHHYTEEELTDVLKAARNAGAHAVLTTEKDAVKIDSRWLQDFPLLTLTVEINFLSGESALDDRIKRTFKTKETQ